MIASRFACLLLVLGLLATGCNSNSSPEESTAPPDEAADPAPEAPAEPPAAPAEPPPPAPEVDPEAAATRAQTVLDATLAPLGAAFTTTPVPAEEDEDDEDSPLDTCLPAEAASIGDEIDASRAAESAASFEANTPTGPIGGYEGEASVDVFADVETATSLFTRFSDAFTSGDVLSCLEATTAELIQPTLPEGAPLTVTAGIDTSLPVDLGLAIMIGTEVNGQPLELVTQQVFVVSGETVTQIQFNGDGSMPFPVDLAGQMVAAARA